MKNTFDSVLEILRKWNDGGNRILSNGTELICLAPHIAPKAWLHKIYVGLSKEEIDDFESKFPVSFPKEYKEFLHLANGINIFSDSLSIWGLRRNYQRTGEAAIQPYDLLSLNEERPKGCPDTWLFFGSYSWDGTKVLFDLSEGPENNKVYRCERWTTNKISEWSNLWEWVYNETLRLEKLYDKIGVKIDKKLPTVP